MKLLTILALLFGLTAFGDDGVSTMETLTSNSQVSYQNQVITAFDPNNYDCQKNVSYHNDVAVVLNNNYNNVAVFAVSEPQYCVDHTSTGSSAYDVMVKFIGGQQVATKQVKVVVQNGLLRRLGFRLFNQTKVNCVQVVKVNGHVTSQKVVKQVTVTGFLVGANDRRVRAAVASCR